MEKLEEKKFSFIDLMELNSDIDLLCSCNRDVKAIDISSVIDDLFYLFDSAISNNQSPVEKELYEALIQMLIKTNKKFADGAILDTDFFEDKPYYKNKYVIYFNNFPINNGKIRPDLVIRKGKNIVVFEIDSFMYHSSADQITKDKIRERKIQELGYPVYRFSAKEIMNNLYFEGGVLSEIDKIISKM